MLLQYVFGYAYVSLEDISENCDSRRKPVTKGNRNTGEYPYYGASGIVDYVKTKPKSTIGTANMEGLVCKPELDMLDRQGNRLIVKVKVKDFC